MKSTMEKQEALIEALDEELDSMDRELLICKGIIVLLVCVLIYLGFHLHDYCH